MNALLRLLLAVCFVVLSQSLFAQSTTENKAFTYVDYEAGLNGIKTAEKAEAIEADLRKLDGVVDCEVVFIEYQLTLRAYYQEVSPEDLKAVLNRHGAEFKDLQTRMVR